MGEMQVSTSLSFVLELSDVLIVVEKLERDQEFCRSFSWSGLKCVCGFLADRFCGTETRTDIPADSTSGMTRSH